MRVLVITHGTRGDVQPQLALAVALNAAGHEAVLAAPASFGPMAASYQVRFAPLDEGPNRMLGHPVIARAIQRNWRGLSGLRGLRELNRLRATMTPRVLADLSTAARDAGDVDLVVHQPGLFAGQQVAEKLDVPAVMAALQPGWVPSGTTPHPAVPPWLGWLPRRSTGPATACSPS